MPSSYKHKANNALGVFVICGLFALETNELEQARPNPATPWVRAGLLTVAVVALILFYRYRRKSRELGE